MKRERENSDGKDDITSLNCSLAATTTTNSNDTLNSTRDDLHKGISIKRDDDGHRYGNFHNYYTFHPVSNRTEHMKEMLPFIANQWKSVTPAHDKELFCYIDIGCNEGDLTLEIARLLSDHLSTPLSNEPGQNENGTATTSQDTTGTRVFCIGMDLDADLIRRAQVKFEQDRKLLLPKIKAKFSVLDVLHEDIVLKEIVDSTTDYCTSSFTYSADLTTMFSTTMWIHIHGGDEGLRRVLQKMCTLTRYWILLEPQPSKCYGRAAFRLRRLGLPPLDVSSDRLRLRPTVEDAIEDIMKEFHFERVELDNSIRYNSTKPERVETKTQWNRPLRLYQRVNAPTSCLFKSLT